MEKITSNTKNDTKKFDDNHKISEAFIKKYRDSNFDVVMEKDQNSDEFKKMIDSMKRNMEFYTEYKRDKMRKDKRLIEALKAGDASMVDDLIINDDAPLSTAEVRFLDEIEDDLDEANQIEKNLARIENEKCVTKKKNLLQYLNDRDPENENYKKYLDYKKHERLFFQIFDYIDATDFDNLTSEDDIKSKKRNVAIISKEAKILWKKYFDLFYTFGFTKLYHYFKNLVFNPENVLDFKVIVERNEWSETNEEIMYSEEVYNEMQEYEDEYREEKYVEFIRTESYKRFRELLIDYKKKDFLGREG